MSKEFQRQKLSYFFNILDLNNNKSLELSDFWELSEKVRETLGFEAESTEHKRIADKATKLFHTLVKDVSTSEYQKISEDEWVQFFEKEVIDLNDEEALDSYKELIFHFMFDFFDHNRDGFISMQEYEDFYKIFGIDITYLNKAFRMLDNSNVGKLSRYDLMDAVEDFLVSEDESVPGNWIFGYWESMPHAQDTV